MRVGSKKERVKSRKERGRMERWSQHKELSLPLLGYGQGLDDMDGWVLFTARRIELIIRHGLEPVFGKEIYSD